MKSITAWWKHFWFAPSTGRPEAYFRVAYCFVLLFDLAGIHSKIHLMFSSAGLHSDLSADFWFTPPWISFFYWAWIFTILMLLAGIYTRLFAVLNFLFHVFFWVIRGYLVSNAGEWISHAMAFYLMFMKSDRFLSLKFRKPAVESPSAVWPIRLAQINFGGMYLTAGISKLVDPGWLSGDAFLETLMNPFISHFDYSWLTPYASLLNLINYGIIFFEIIIPFGLMWRPTRPWVLLTAAVFHLGIDLTIKVGWFTYFATAYLLIFWDDLPWTRSKFRPSALPAKPFTSGFIFLHLLSFLVLHLTFIAENFTNRSFKSIPFFSNYGKLTRIHYFNVWPSGFFLHPVKFLFFEATHADGSLAPLPPFGKNGRWEPGLGFSKEARLGLIFFQISLYGLRHEQWKALTDYLVQHYQRVYDGSCPREIRIYVIRQYLPNFKGSPKALDIEKPLILRANVRCQEKSTQIDLDFSSFGKSFVLS